MWRWRIFSILFLVTSGSSWQTADEFRSAYTSAEQRSDLRTGQPFILVATISVAQGKNKANGKYRLAWFGKDKWREDVVIGPDYLGELKIDGRTYSKFSSRKAEYILGPFRNIGAYPHAELPEAAKNKSISEVHGGKSLRCARLQSDNAPEQKICLNEESLITTFNDLQYSDFRDVMNRKFPYVWRAHINGLDYEGTVDTLASISTAPAELFLVDNSWESSPVCEAAQGKPAKLINHIPPEYPALAKQTRTQGSVIVRATINELGEVVNAEAVSGTPILREAAVKAVKQWRYEPTKCGDHPVAVDTTITVNFSLNQ